MGTGRLGQGRGMGPLAVVAALGLAVVAVGCRRPAADTSQPTRTSQPPMLAAGWHMMAAAPLPANMPSRSSIGVWTGSELLLQVDPGDYSDRVYDIAYDPYRNSWRTLPPDPFFADLSVDKSIAPNIMAIWDGTEVLMWGGGEGSALNPTTNTWRRIGPGPVSPETTVWTGTQVLTWSSCCEGGDFTISLYDPVAQDRTSPRLPAPLAPRLPAPLAPRYTNGVWTGTELVVVGGSKGSTYFADAAAFHPATNTWRMLPPMPSPRGGGALTWSGSEVLVVGGFSSDNVLAADDVAYSPATNSWRRLPASGSPRFGHVAVWAGRQLLVWGGSSEIPGTYGPNTPPPIPPRAGDVAYRPRSNSWSALPDSPLSGRGSALGVWTGTALLIWGGYSLTGDGGQLADGAIYIPEAAS